ATGYRGFYYHFLDMQTGKRAWQCELSTVDSAFLFAGMLTAAAYFRADTPEQREIRELADLLYRRADWAWAQAADGTIGHGWHPESGFIPHQWQGYDEGLLLYTLALGSPLRVEARLRPRLPLLRPAVHPPAVARVDRLPRHPGRLHARQGHRLLREQPARQPGAAALRGRQPAGFQGLRRGVLGHHRQRRSRRNHPHRRWRRT